ncbi:MAG: hypothetical protein Tsb009_37640 [Planctomycetaceae bacterium]
MENQRFILFIALSFAVFIAWINFGPKIFPGLFPKPVQKKNEDDEAKTAKSQSAQKTNVAKKTADSKTGKTGDAKTGKTKTIPELKKAKPKPPKPQLALHPPKVIKLGSLDPKSGYFIEAELTTRGASVVTVRLNDKRYGKIADPDTPLQVVGNTTDKLRTLATSVPTVDSQLKKQGGLSKVHWAILPKSTIVENGVTRGVTFYFDAPDGSLRVTKKFWLEPVKLEEGISDRALREIQDTNSTGYELKMELAFEEKSNQLQTLQYTLQGPVGLPLENVENARVFRGIVAGLYEESGEVTFSDLTAAKLVEAETEQWERPLRFIGIDTQYFAALLIPGGDQLKSPYTKLAEASVVEEATKAEHSDITLELQSQDLELAAGGKVAHTYTLYCGPKRKELLKTYGATEAIKYGWFGIIAQGMLWLLTLFHDYMFIPYGFAIICLTVVVRGAMFPLSLKQAKSAQKMKELQPKIAELKKKYGDDREKMARAQMELFQKHGYNPFAGCLPIFLQLPIFIGLYQALSNAVDLRLAPFPFTWIKNLAAPDALFRLPFRLPFLGQDFNLLPLITMTLFIVQQKLFMPPPADEQQAMQQKMMSWMSVIFGFIFYRVPAGLCIYFIASSLWGIGERKLLDVKKNKEDANPENTESGDKSSTPKEEPVEKPKGFFGKLLELADQAADARAKAEGKTEPSQNGNTGQQKPGQNRGGKKKKGRRKNKRKR